MKSLPLWLSCASFAIGIVSGIGLATVAVKQVMSTDAFVALQIVVEQIKKAEVEKRNQDAKQLKQVEEFLLNFLEMFST